MSLLHVVDSSAAIKWFTIEPDSDKALLLLGSGLRLAAPDVVLAETANALRRKERMGVMAASTVVTAMIGMPGLFEDLVPSKELISDAVALSQSIDHSVYDCLYIVASRALRAPLITSDDKLVRKVAGTGDASRVTLLSNWSPTP